MNGRLRGIPGIPVRRFSDRNQPVAASKRGSVNDGTWLIALVPGMQADESVVACQAQEEIQDVYLCEIVLKYRLISKEKMTLFIFL